MHQLLHWILSSQGAKKSLLELQSAALERRARQATHSRVNQGALGQWTELNPLFHLFAAQWSLVCYWLCAVHIWDLNSQVLQEGLCSYCVCTSLHSPPEDFSILCSRLHKLLHLEAALALLHSSKSHSIPSLQPTCFQCTPAKIPGSWMGDCYKNNLSRVQIHSLKCYSEAELMTTNCCHIWEFIGNWLQGPLNFSCPQH